MRAIVAESWNGTVAMISPKRRLYKAATIIVLSGLGVSGLGAAAHASPQVVITSSAATTSPSHALTVASSSRVPSGVPIDKIDPRATDPQRFGGLLRAAANAISSAVKAVKSAWNAFAKAVKKSFDAFKAWWKNHAWPAIERLATAWSLYEIWNELRNLIG